MILNRDDDPQQRPVLVETNDFREVTRIVAEATEGKPPKTWLVLMALCGSLLCLMTAMIGYLFWEGTGVWGLNIPVAWGWDIVNFVWWVGIAHAGTLISAILFLFRQKWRTVIGRFAEATTIFSLVCAGMFPAIHVGRVWLIYYVLPIPNQMGMWPNARSPLFWDAFAVNTYLTVSILFWYMGMIPDLATLRDRSVGKIRQIVLGILAMGWRGSARHWQNFERAYLIMAGIMTPLVFSVSSIVGWDFAMSKMPGWHATIFAVYFVYGAVFAGFGLVTILLIVTREVFGFKKLIRMHHVDNMNKFTLVIGSLMAYTYLMETFIAWYSGNIYERFVFWERAFGTYWWAYFLMLFGNVVMPQLFWFRKIRYSIPMTFIIGTCICVGMWFERFVIVITLHADFLPSSWGYFKPTWVDALTFIGTLGLFGALMLLFLKFVPQLAIAEVKAAMPEADPHASAGAHS